MSAAWKVDMQMLLVHAPDLRLREQHWTDVLLSIVGDTYSRHLKPKLTLIVVFCFAP